jgi:hypothetical protein
MNTKLLILAVLGVFVAGAGTLSARDWGKHAGEAGGGWHGKGMKGKFGKHAVRKMRNALSHHLDLNENQEKKAEAIIAAKVEKMKALFEETRKKAQAIRNEGISELKPSLSEEQGAKLERLAKRMDRRRAERRAFWLGEKEGGESGE